MSSQAISELDLRQRIVAAVRQAENPITVATLAKLVKVKEERIRTELKLAAENHELFWWPKYRKSDYLWNVPFEEKAREAVLAAAGLCALSKTDLGKVSAKRIRGISAKSMESFVRILADERRLRAVPAFSGRSKLYVIAGEAEGFFTAAHHFVEKKIKQAGFDPEAFFARETVSKESSEHKGHAADAPKLILDAIKTLEPVKGVPVSTLRLRNHLRILNKQDFDIAALELRKRQEVYLSQHADPHNISQEEKDLLIDGQDGTYYVGIAVR
jgi:hypothetical protein